MNNGEKSWNEALARKWFSVARRETSFSHDFISGSRTTLNGEKRFKSKTKTFQSNASAHRRIVNFTSYCFSFFDLPDSFHLYTNFQFLLLHSWRLKTDAGKEKRTWRAGALHWIEELLMHQPREWWSVAWLGSWVKSGENIQWNKGYWNPTSYWNLLPRSQPVKIFIRSATKTLCFSSCKCFYSHLFLLFLLLRSALCQWWIIDGLSVVCVSACLPREACTTVWWKSHLDNESLIPQTKVMNSQSSATVGVVERTHREQMSIQLFPAIVDFAWKSQTEEFFCIYVIFLCCLRET